MADSSANRCGAAEFRGGPDAVMQAINASMGFDRRLGAGHRRQRAPTPPCWPPLEHHLR